MPRLESTAHQPAQSCCPPQARVLLALAAGHQLPRSPPLPGYQQPQKGCREGGSSCSGVLTWGKVAVRQCWDSHSVGRVTGAVTAALQWDWCAQVTNTANTQRAHRNGLLPGVCGIHAWQRDLGRWIFFSILPG